MSQKHVEQFGTFHITTNARGRVPWCTMEGIPEILIRDLKTASELFEVEIKAFCVLPNHMHILCFTGPKGLSRFIQSFKSNSSRNIRRFTRSRSSEHVLRATGTYALQRNTVRTRTWIYENILINTGRAGVMVSGDEPRTRATESEKHKTKNEPMINENPEPESLSTASTHV